MCGNLSTVTSLHGYDSSRSGRPQTSVIGRALLYHRMNASALPCLDLLSSLEGRVDR